MSWRVSGLAGLPAVRVVSDAEPDGVLAGAKAGAGLPLSWASLHMFNAPGTHDKRTAAATYQKLGLHPIALHGLLDDGMCTCGKFPCGTDNRSAGKHPIERGWQTAPLDLLRLDETLLRNWRFNIGLRMGLQRSGWFLVTVDVDGPRSLLEPLEREHGAFPPTLTARTGSGGLHMVYRLRDGLTMGNRTHVVTNIDIRGTGGQMVAAPSQHKNGNRYSWIDVREPTVLP